ncbi:hypothetical protein CKO16_14730, partial [Rhodoblastus acidophilus]
PPEPVAPETRAPVPPAPEESNDLFAPLPGPAAAPAPQPAPEPPPPPPRTDSDTLESLEEEMAKLLGRPTHKP